MEVESMGDGEGNSSDVLVGGRSQKAPMINPMTGSEEFGGNLKEMEAVGSFREALLRKSARTEEMMEEDGFDEEMDMEDFEIEEFDESLVKEMPMLKLSKQERQQLWRPWMKALIIKVIGKSLPYNFLVQRLQFRWRVQGDMKVIDVGNGFYLVTLPSWEDRVRVLTEGPWVIAGHYLSVQRWRPEFNPFKEQIRRMAVWVRFPFLPFEYYHASVLVRIGNLLGKTLKIDRNTEMANKEKFARVCIEMDTAKPLVSRIIVGGKVQNVEYEGMGTVCFHCGCIGHKDNMCEKIAKETGKESEAGRVEEVGKQNYNGETEGNFGPWMLVQNRRNVSRNKDKGKVSKENQRVKGNNFQILESMKEQEDSGDREERYGED